MLHPKIKEELKIELSKIGPIRALMDKLVVVKVGTPEKPATADDLQDVTQMLCDLLKGTDLNIIVTHHAIEFKIMPENTQLVSTIEEQGDELF